MSAGHKLWSDLCYSLCFEFCPFSFSFVQTRLGTSFVHHEIPLSVFAFGFRRPTEVTEKQGTLTRRKLQEIRQKMTEIFSLATLLSDPLQETRRRTPITTVVLPPSRMSHNRVQGRSTWIEELGPWKDFSSQVPKRVNFLRNTTLSLSPEKAHRNTKDVKKKTLLSKSVVSTPPVRTHTNGLNVTTEKWLLRFGYSPVVRRHKRYSLRPEVSQDSWSPPVSKVRPGSSTRRDLYTLEPTMVRDKYHLDSRIIFESEVDT